MVYIIQSIQHELAKEILQTGATWQPKVTDIFRPFQKPGLGSGSGFVVVLKQLGMKTAGLWLRDWRGNSILKDS